jgi:hypothetical protein
VQPAEKLKREIARSYDSNPKGWNVFVGRDNQKFTQTLISNSSNVWILKEEIINPYKSVGLGVKLVEQVDSLKSVAPQEFGLRPLNQRQIKRLIDLTKKEKSPRDLLLGIMKSKPVSSNNIKSPLILQGPIMTTENPLSLLSDKHQELDRKLNSELNKLLLRKYPQTVIPYL